MVDGSHLSAERFAHLLLEGFWLVGHHLFRLLEGQSHGVVSSCPGVVERSLVTAQVHPDVFLGKTFPEVHHIAYISHRHGAAFVHRLAYGRYQFVELVVQLVYPSLLIPFAGSLGVDFSHHAHHAGDVAGFGLGARHATESG